GAEQAALKQALPPFGDEGTLAAGPAAPMTAPAPKDRPPGTTQTTHTPGKLSALDAAFLVLAETGQPMTCQELIGAMAGKGYWSSPAGLTPQATLYTAVTMLPNAV